MTDKQSIPFHYIKSNFFRVVHADGATGGVTPTGDIFFSIYSQRGPIPQVQVYELTEAGELGSERPNERVTKDGIIREVEVGVTISVTVAQALTVWLQEKIELAKRLAASNEKGDNVSPSSSTH